MCRILAYLGEPLPVEHLLFDTDNSLVRQSYSPRLMNTFLNLAGFGLKAWDPTSLRPEDPFSYRATHAAVVRPQPAAHLGQDRVDLPRRARPRGHLLGRGDRRRQNLHPFHFAGARVVLAHNGHLRQFARMRYALVEHVQPELAQCIEGTTDSEWIYALDPLAARRSLRRAGDARAGRGHRRRAPHPARRPRRARHRHLLAGEPLRQHRQRRGRDPRLVRLRLVPARGRDARDRPPVREPLVRDRRRVRRATTATGR